MGKQKADKNRIDQTLAAIAIVHAAGSHTLYDAVISLPEMQADGPEGGLGKRFRERKDYFAPEDDPFTSDISDQSRAERFFKAALAAETGSSVSPGKKPITQDDGERKIWLMLAAKFGSDQARELLIRDSTVEDELKHALLSDREVQETTQKNTSPTSRKQQWRNKLTVPESKKNKKVIMTPERYQNVNAVILRIISAEHVDNPTVKKLLQNDGPDGGLGKTAQSPEKYFKINPFDERKSERERARIFYQMAKAFESGTDTVKQDQGKKLLCLAMAAKLGQIAARKELLADPYVDVALKQEMSKHLKPYNHQCCLLVNKNQESVKEARGLNQKYKNKHHISDNHTSISTVKEHDAFPKDGDLRIYIVGHGSPGSLSISDSDSIFSKSENAATYAENIALRLHEFNFKKHRVHISVLSCDAASPDDKGNSFAKELATCLHKKGLPVEVSGRTAAVTVDHGVERRVSVVKKGVAQQTIKEVNKKHKQLDTERKKLGKIESCIQSKLASMNDKIDQGVLPTKKLQAEIRELQRERQVLLDEIQALEDDILRHKTVDASEDQEDDFIIIEPDENKKTGKMTYYKDDNRTHVIHSYRSEAQKKLQELRESDDVTSSKQNQDDELPIRALGRKF